MQDSISLGNHRYVRVGVVHRVVFLRRSPQAITGASTRLGFDRRQTAVDLDLMVRRDGPPSVAQRRLRRVNRARTWGLRCTSSLTGRDRQLCRREDCVLGMESCGCKLSPSGRTLAARQLQVITEQ
jgi:hypothetical protein